MHKTTSRNFREFNFRSSGIIRFHDIFVIWGFFKELLVWASAFNLNIILTYICKRNYSTFKNEEQFRAHKVVNIRIWCTGYKSSYAHFVQATYDLLFIRKIISWQCEIEWNIVSPLKWSSQCISNQLLVFVECWFFKDWKLCL